MKITAERKLKLQQNLIAARARKAELSRLGLLKEKQTKNREKAEAEARDIYIKRIYPALKKLTDIQMEEAVKPENREERKYVIDQLIGKPAEVKKVNVDKQSLKNIETEMRDWGDGKAKTEAVKEETPTLDPNSTVNPNSISNTDTQAAHTEEETTIEPLE
jgi:hypothetical protein